jgi:hypothetical protein
MCSWSATSAAAQAMVAGRTGSRRATLNTATSSAKKIGPYGYPMIR